jgi:hypothetical protein
VARTISVVFYIGLDPVALGLVASLNRQGGNLTGVTRWNVIVGPKRLQLLHELAPHATAMALLVNPTSPELAEADSKNSTPPSVPLDCSFMLCRPSTRVTLIGFCKGGRTASWRPGDWHKVRVYLSVR